MAGIKDISSIWNNLKEIDLKPIREAATTPVRITIAGAPGAGKHTLAEQMRIDPARPDVKTQSPITLLTLERDNPTPTAHLIILMVEAERADCSMEQALVQKWSDAGKNVLVFVNKIDLVNGSLPAESGQGWMATKVLIGSANSSEYLRKEFVPAVLEMLPQQHLALGRQFPLFRLTIAHQLINETCFSNAAYSFSTGLAEIVPVLDLPLNLTDLVVLTKSQAFLAFKLGLLVGFSTRWQDYVTEFGGVIGGGFVWRQAARSLVGLVPGWGILPKVAIAYSGTYVVGHAILGWYLSGRHLNSKQMRELSLQAFARGKEYASKLREKLPRRSLEGQKQELPEIPSSDTALLTVETGSGTDEIVITKRPIRKRLESPTAEIENANNIGGQSSVKGKPVEQKKRRGKLRLIHVPRLGRQKKETTPAMLTVRVCENCGKVSSTDAAFCQYCGTAFKTALPE